MEWPAQFRERGTAGESAVLHYSLHYPCCGSGIVPYMDSGSGQPVTLICIRAPLKLHLGIRSLLPAKGRPQKVWSAWRPQDKLWSGKEKMRKEEYSPLPLSCAYEWRSLRKLWEWFPAVVATGATQQRTRPLQQRLHSVSLAWSCRSLIPRQTQTIVIEVKGNNSQTSDVKDSFSGCGWKWPWCCWRCRNCIG